MRLAHEIIKAIAAVRGLTVGGVDLDAAMQRRRPIYYWHTLNGLYYTRYQLLGHNNGTNILVTRTPNNTRKDAVAEVGVTCWSFIEVDGHITDTVHAFRNGQSLWLGDEDGDRIMLNVTASVWKVDHGLHP